MKFEERKTESSKLLVEFLGQYSPPRGLDDSQLASRISYAADAFARRIPDSPDFSEMVSKVLNNIRDTHLSNTWPVQAAFVVAMPQGEFRKSAPKTYQPDDKTRIPRMMAQGIPVPESEVWKSHSVSQSVIDRYRSASVDSWRSVYSHDAERLMCDKYGGQVSYYFSEAMK